MADTLVLIIVIAIPASLGALIYTIPGLLTLVSALMISAFAE